MGVSFRRWSNEPLQPRKPVSFAKAKAELQNKAFNSPIIWTTLLWTTAWSNKASSFKQSVESKRLVTMSQTFKALRWWFPKYHLLQRYVAARDYDISGRRLGSWLPHPSTYLEGISPVNGSVFYYLGIGRFKQSKPLQQLVWITNMLKDADANCWPLNAMKICKAAQAWLTDSSITLPTVLSQVL